MQAAPEPIASLLLAIDELSADGVPSKRTLTLLPNARRKQCATIRISLLPVTDDLREMSISRDHDVAILEFTEVGLSNFREALTAWKDGGEDFCIHPRGKKTELGTKDQSSGELWFWTPMTDP